VVQCTINKEQLAITSTIGWTTNCTYT